MSIAWIAEARDLPPDPVSGAAITRLTTSPCINTNIYCEQPYCSADGNRIAIVRTMHHTPFQDLILMAADLRNLKLAIVEPDVSDVCTAAWRGRIYYRRATGELMYVDLDTLERHVVLTDPNLPANTALASISPDFRYAVGRTYLPGPTVGIVLLDLEKGTWEVIFEHPEIVNPHLQFNPVHGRQVLVQHNRGVRLQPDGKMESNYSALGTTLFTLDIETRETSPLPVGPPVTAGATGHECFAADTGRVVFTTAWNQDDWSLDQRFPTGNLFTAAPGDEAPRVIPTPEHRFNHVCASRCGKYALLDCYPDRFISTVPLVMVNLETGKYRALIQDCGADGGGAQYTHPHAYLTGDNRRIVYQATPHGIPHVFTATIPEAFLASLD